MSPDPDSILPVGTIVDDKFRITREIGRGGMAIVYEAENVDIKKRVAVKMLASELTGSRVITERFMREARAAAAIRSPYICDVYDVATFDGRPFLVMELLEGESLYERMSTQRQLTVDQTLTIATQICKALAKAHGANVVHRDLKPENIFLTENEDGQTVAKIVDFGLAKFYEAENEGGDKARLTKEGALFGTPAYMSPEQAKAQIDVDHRADLWALACIVYECLTGRTVWNVDQGVAMILAQIAGAPIPRPSRFRPDLPPAFDEWFVRALDRDITRRFQTAKEFSDRLARALLSPSIAEARAPLSTDVEGLDVDRILAGDVTDSSPRVPPSWPNPLPAVPSTLPPAAKGRRPGVPIAVLVLLSVAVATTYGVWHFILTPPGPSATAQPLESEPFATQIGAGQEALAQGDPEGAAEWFAKAFESSKENVARSFVAHLDVRSESPESATCRLTGLGRPRAFMTPAEPVSAPSVLSTAEGIVVAWGEAQSSAPRHRQAFTTLLDSSLRRIRPVTTATPEGQSVQEPTLFSGPSGPLIAYWETHSTPPSAMLRPLDEQGRGVEASTPVGLSPAKQRYPHVVAGASDDAWVVWSEQTHQRVYDLMAQRIDGALKRRGPTVRLTAGGLPKAGNSIATTAVAALQDEVLVVAYGLERQNDHQVLALVIRHDDPRLAGGGLAPDGATEPGPESRHVGKLVSISLGPGKHTTPQVACANASCFIAWDDEKAGAHVALLDTARGEVSWRRELDPAGHRPALGHRDDAFVVSWFAGNRLKLASLSHDTVGVPGVLGRANGYQPSPSIVPAFDDRTWLVAWRDFEAARNEAFVLRAACK
jgi:eukaryotic-like serine/threonine-protein kinase